MFVLYGSSLFDVGHNSILDNFKEPPLRLFVISMSLPPVNCGIKSSSIVPVPLSGYLRLPFTE